MEELEKQLGIPSNIVHGIHTLYSNPANDMKELLKVWLQQPYHSSENLKTWRHVAAMKSPKLGE